MDQTTILAGFDLSASISGDTLNNFLQVHWTVEHPKTTNVYKGSGSSDQLKLSYTYDILKAAVINLSPVPQFATRYKRWVLTLPEVLSKRHESDVLPFVNTPPSNLSVVLPEIQISITFTPLTAPTQPVTVNLSYSLTAIGSVKLNTQDIIQIVPISVVLSDPQAFSKELDRIKTELAQLQKMDDPCQQYTQLIEYIANQIIADKISSFIINFPIPTPISLFNPVTLGNLNLSIANNYIIITGNVGPNASAATADDVAKTISALTTTPNPGIVLLFSNNFFQVMANNFLNLSYQDAQTGSKGIFFYKLFYFYAINGPLAAISGNRKLDINFNFHRWRLLICRRPYPLCGDIDAINVSATASANPAKLHVTFNIDNSARTLSMSIGTKPFAITWNFSGLGFPIDQIIDVILDILASDAA